MKHNVSRQDVTTHPLRQAAQAAQANLAAMERIGKM